MPDATTRTEYALCELRRSDLKATPMEQFEAWYQQAATAAQIHLPNAMSLATVSAEGQPSLRTVLLKRYDENGFVFFTNLESRKARDIEANAGVALMFAWLPLERQVIVEGTATRVSTAESLCYFLTRPRGSQIAAWISAQSSTISSRKVLEMEWEHMAKKFADGQIPLPSFWGGYRVSPRRVEFWQGRPNRLHDRFRYSQSPNNGRWLIERLAP